MGGFGGEIPAAESGAGVGGRQLVARDVESAIDSLGWLYRLDDFNQFDRSGSGSNVFTQARWWEVWRGTCGEDGASRSPAAYGARQGS